MTQVRLARLEDVPSILAISNRAALETAANFAVAPESLDDWQAGFRRESPMYPWYVADDGGAIAGFARASPWKGRCAYAYSAEVSVYVRPEHHRRGIGRALYERLFATLREQGYRTIVGGIALPNPGSVALHEAFGLRRVAVFERIGWKFGRWHDVGYWAGDLQRSPAPPRPIRPVLAVEKETG